MIDIEIKWNLKSLKADQEKCLITAENNEGQVMNFKYKRQL